MTGPQCSETFAAAVGTQYTTAVIGYSICAALAFSASLWRNYLLYQASGRFIPDGWLDIQRVFHYASLVVAACFAVHAADPNNWDNTFPQVVEELVYEIPTAIMISCLIVLVFFWRTSSRSHGGSLTLSKGEQIILPLLIASMLIYATAFSFFEVYGPNRGTIRFFKLAGYAVVTSTCAVSTLAYGSSMVSTLSASCNGGDLSGIAAQARKKLLLFLFMLAAVCAVAVFGMLWYGISAFQVSGQTAPTAFEVSLFDPVYVLYVFCVLFFFRTIRKQAPLLEK
eukprot:GILJ01003218.1.p1 GENE.GILJ01003218.1~~GILJ01003218.1.p1  ORF type:complete len:304 (-),score=30.43 GILJ01003218.1:76-921(-)